MKKDFDKWNEEKKKIDAKIQGRFYHPREIWWCSLGVNVGFEQDGEGEEYQRPVLIFKGFSRDTCLIFPLTKSVSKHKMRISIGIVDEKEASVIISQPRLVDTKRLVERIGFLNKEIFETVRKAVRDTL